MSELKPCPFCSGQPQLCAYRGHNWFQCTTCWTTSGDNIQSEDEAVAAWNRRTPSPAVRALVDELRAYIAELRRGSSGRRFIVEEALAAVEREIGEASNE